MEFKSIAESIKSELSNDLGNQELAIGEIIYNNGNCQILSQSGGKFDFLVNDNSLEEAKVICLGSMRTIKLFPTVKTRNRTGTDIPIVACFS